MLRLVQLLRREHWPTELTDDLCDDLVEFCRVWRDEEPLERVDRFHVLVSETGRLLTLSIQNYQNSSLRAS